MISGFLVVHIIRKWQKKTRRRRMRGVLEVHEQEEDELEAVVYAEKEPEVNALLWTAIMKNYMLKMMDKNMVKKFLAAMKKEVITPGTTIVSQGHRGNKYCVIITGLIDAFAYKLGSQAREHFIQTKKAGQSFGETALVANDLSSVTLRARTACTVYVLTQREFSAIVAQRNHAKKMVQFLQDSSIDCTNLFSNFSYSELVELAQHFTIFSAEPGHKLIKQGDTSFDWFIIKEGEVKIMRDGIEVALLRKSQWFGEFSMLLGDGMRNADCVAGEKCEVMMLTGEHCLEIFPRLLFNDTYVNRIKLMALQKIPVPLVKNITMSHVATMNEHFHNCTFSPGQVVVREGELPDYFYIILSGEMSVVKQIQQYPRMIRRGSTGTDGSYVNWDPTGMQQQQQSDGNHWDPQSSYNPAVMQQQVQYEELATLHPEDSVGARALLGNQTHQFTVLAKTEVQGLLLAKVHFNQMLLNARRREWSRLLRTWPLFITLKGRLVHAIAERMDMMHFQQGEVIVRQGSREGTDRFYVIKEGKCVVMRSEQGAYEPKCLMRLEAGAFFGEQSILMGDPHENTVVATSPVTVLWVHMSIFKERFASLTMLLWEHIAWMQTGNKNVTSPIEERIRDQNLTLNDLKISRTLGKGQFGRVLLATSLKTRQQYALKVLTKRNVIKTGQVMHLRTETEILKQLEHPFCNKLVTTFKDDQNLYMLVTLCPGGDLLKMQESCPDGVLTDHQAKFYTANILLGLEYLHSLDIAYRDLKQENLMLDAQGYIKIVDFGLSKYLRDDNQTYTLCGTPQFLAPEVITCQGHNKSVDFWALGVLIYELLAGTSPFTDSVESDDPEDILSAILEGKYTIPSTIKPACADFINKLLDRDPKTRMGASGAGGVKEAKKHPWFHDFDWTALTRRRITAPFVPDVADLEGNFGKASRESFDINGAKERETDQEVLTLLDDVF